LIPAAARSWGSSSRWRIIVPILVPIVNFLLGAQIYVV
jgi:hypothetical protein